MKAAIYARVSTLDKGQEVENQLHELRNYCLKQGWDVIEYVDHASGKSGDRGEFKRMFEDAKLKKFEVLTVWALDRLTREGVLETLQYIQTLTKHGIQFESFTEPHFRTTGATGELMLSIFAWIAKQERLRISERTKAGMNRARRDGKTLGRPVRVFRRDEALAMKEQGMSLRNIAAELNVSPMTVSRALKSGLKPLYQNG
jgi:DNA invertase Pin-like site-specific DNA recombinase